MRTLAHDSSQVPPRYQVKPHTLSVESGVIRAGASSDIRKGRLGDKTVAVKTLRTVWKIGPHNARKVCVTHYLFLWDMITNAIPNLALLQGVYHLDERFSSPPLTAHCCRHRSSHWLLFDDFENDDEREYQGLYQ